MKKINFYTGLSFMVTVFLLLPSLIFSCDRGRGNWIISVVNKSDVAVEIKNDYKKKSVVVPAGQTISLSDFMIPWTSYYEKMQIILKTQDKGFSESIVYQLNEGCFGSRRLNVFEINKQIPITDGKEYTMTILPTYALEIGEGATGLPTVATISPADYVAVYINDVQKLLPYVSASGIDTQNNMLSTPLHLAVAAHNLETVKALLKLRPSLTLKDKNGQTALDLAVVHSLVPIAQELLRAGAPTTYKDSAGNTLLHIAVGKRIYELKQFDKQLELVKSFLAAGMDVNVQNKSGMTPLHLAVTVHNFDIVKELLKAQPSLILKDKNGHTPVDIAVMYSLVEIVEELLDAGAPIMDKDSDGNTLLHIAVNNKTHDLARFRQLHLARLLLEKGVNVDAQNKYGTTPLHLAVVTNNYDMVKLLLSFNPTLTLKDINNNTPFELALTQANGKISAAIADSLIKRGLITPETRSSYTYALFLAMKNKLDNVAKKLFEAGVPMTDKDLAFYKELTPVKTDVALKGSDSTQV